MEKESVFNRITSLVTVRDLMTPLLPPVDADRNTDNYLGSPLHEFKYPHNSHISLVKQDGRTIGWCNTVQLSHISLMQKEITRIIEITRPIPSDKILSLNTSYFKAVEVFGRANRPDIFFVLDNDELVGYLEESALYSIPAKLCLFALTLELEQIALDVCLVMPEKAWNCLSPGRRASTEEKFRLRHRTEKGKPPEVVLPQELLISTTIVDKKEILTKSKWLPSEYRLLAEVTFKNAERVRNACAHPGREDVLYDRLSGRSFYEFVEGCHKLINVLKLVYERVEQHSIDEDVRLAEMLYKAESDKIDNEEI